MSGAIAVAGATSSGPTQPNATPLRDTGKTSAQATRSNNARSQRAATTSKGKGASGSSGTR
ncbi:hypothetical protein [Streptomyces microflavus]|uniref:hypothetical protein n=1 Tax=Streptomyces microflavus TaxID=1919 RepID=UPI0036B04014